MTELLDNFVFSSHSALDDQEQKQVLRFLESLVSFRFDDLVDRLLAHFDCEVRSAAGNYSDAFIVAEVRALAIPGSIQRNPRMKLHSISKVIAMLSGMIRSQNKSVK